MRRSSRRGDTSVVRLGSSLTCRVVIREPSVGARGKLLLRPETLHLVPRGEVPEGHNAFPGRVSNSLVTGGTVKHFVTVENGDCVTVQELTNLKATSLLGDGVGADCLAHRGWTVLRPIGSAAQLGRSGSRLHLQRCCEWRGPAMTTRKLDNVDRHLIALLESNARESVTNIAKALGNRPDDRERTDGPLERDGSHPRYTVMLRSQALSKSTSSAICCWRSSGVHRTRPSISSSGFRRSSSVRWSPASAISSAPARWPTWRTSRRWLVEVASGTGIRNIRSIVAMSTRIDRRGAVSALQSFPGAAGIGRGEAG